MKKIVLFTLLTALTFSCSKEEFDIDSQIENTTLEYSSKNCHNCSLDIYPLIDACYPSSYPYGRYKLKGFPGGATIRWSANNANIILANHNEVYVAPTSQYDFKIIAAISYPCASGRTCNRTYWENYVPLDCSGGDPAPSF